MTARDKAARFEPGGFALRSERSVPAIARGRKLVNEKGGGLPNAVACQMAEPEGFEPSIGLYKPITV